MLWKHCGTMLDPATLLRPDVLEPARWPIQWHCFVRELPVDCSNRPGTPWPDVDVTILEMGLLAREGYEDQLTVAYLSMMSHINDLVEKNQHSDRPTLVVTDEGHLITTHPLLANYVVKITKMWRKLGAWFCICDAEPWGLSRRQPDECSI